MMRDSRIESLMVIGYNPSHSNINSEVNAPFKILSTLLRYLNTETKAAQGNFGGPLSPSKQKGGMLSGYKMARVGGGLGSGERLDTMEGYNDLYDEEDDEAIDGDEYKYGESEDEDDSENENMDGSDEKKEQRKKRKNKHGNEQEKIEVNLDDIEDDDDQECLLDYRQNEMNIKGQK